MGEPAFPFGTFSHLKKSKFGVGRGFRSNVGGEITKYCLLPRQSSHAQNLSDITVLKFWISVKALHSNLWLILISVRSYYPALGLWKEALQQRMVNCKCQGWQRDPVIHEWGSVPSTDSSSRSQKCRQGRAPLLCMPTHTSWSQPLLWPKQLPHDLERWHPSSSPIPFSFILKPIIKRLECLKVIGYMGVIRKSLCRLQKMSAKTSNVYLRLLLSTQMA